MENETQTKQESKNIGWYFFIAAMFAGIGIGKLAGNPGAGTMIGMAAGFVAIGIYTLVQKNKDEK
ncbi:MAG: hypothetical protein JKY54_04520 [Flavobacteriales bacterium]|nr:hypothetical protein [Flavobacteriales bacterium]